MAEGNPLVAIVDYGMGNLFSIKHACSHVGLNTVITTSPADISGADAVILPGVGAFGDAMERLHRLDLVQVLRDIADSPIPLLGVCLGMQLLMEESSEFGSHKGLGIVPGTVDSLGTPSGQNGKLKVPHIGWEGLCRIKGDVLDPWAGSLFGGLADGTFMYFVHSLYVVPEAASVQIATTRYGDVEFCSALSHKSIFACQCHPERSGVEGLKVYYNLARLLEIKRNEKSTHQEP
jgi:imidazole glycerol-phosphate synthase subunit HisH